MPTIKSKQGAIYIEPESVMNYKWRFLVNPWYWISVFAACLIAVFFYAGFSIQGAPDFFSAMGGFGAGLIVAISTRQMFGW
jgi:hypothetical protein